MKTTEEKEIKVRVIDDIPLSSLKKIIETLFKVKFGKGGQVNDIYYDLPNDFYFKLNQGLRIRDNKEIAYKSLFFIVGKKPSP